MIYRDFGKTGVKISALGFGCMRFPEHDGKVDEEKAIPMIRRAFEGGVNYYDSAPYYCSSQSEIVMGKAVKPFRDKVMLSTKSPLGDFQETADYRRALERSLKKMDTDYVDFYHFWGIGKGSYDDQIAKYDFLTEARKAKEEGLIRHISFSFHDDPRQIKYIIDKCEEFGVPMESMLVQYNLLDRASEEGIAYAHSKGLGVVAMGPVGGGRLSAPTEFAEKLAGVPTYELAFKFVLGNPNINCALSGMQTMEMVEQNLKVGDNEANLSAEDWEKIGEGMERLKKFSDLYCTGCGYCQPCPAGINIPHIFNMYTLHNVYGLTEHGKNGYRHYKVVEGKPAAEACTQCGLCETKCPQKLRIRDELKRVDEIMMKL